jgi:hypothetical protein
MGFLNICLRQPGFYVIGGLLLWSHKYLCCGPQHALANGLALEFHQFISIIAYTAGVARINGPHDLDNSDHDRLKIEENVSRHAYRFALFSLAITVFCTILLLIGQLVPSVQISFLRG